MYVVHENKTCCILLLSNRRTRRWEWRHSSVEIQMEGIEAAVLVAVRLLM